MLEPPFPGPLDAVRERPGGRSARIRADVLRATRIELLSGGYPGLSHRAVAHRAGVDPTTVYRRWPTRSRLVADALLDYASQAVPVPDTGSILTDLSTFLDSILGTLADPGSRGVFQTLAAAGADAEPDLAQTLTEFWAARFTGAEVMIARAVARGELSTDVDAHAVIEMLVAPAYFRTLVSGTPIDADFTRRNVQHALTHAHHH